MVSHIFGTIAMSYTPASNGLQNAKFKSGHDFFEDGKLLGRRVMSVSPFEIVNKIIQAIEKDKGQTVRDVSKEL